ncbi:hypothetical protein BRC97_08810 [Halobacteriales archaeon QS_6_71_20]|nr:MAG: hypothetical protein BRC97_08810 [Halobacteriales archaeon QS_6_71_20]
MAKALVRVYEPFGYEILVLCQRRPGTRHAEAGTGMTECPICSMRMEHGTGHEIDHPLRVLEAAPVDTDAEV